MKHLFAAVLVVLVAAVIAPAALADAPSPVSLTGTTVTNADGSRTLTVSGTYEWEKKCDPKKPDGYAIAWNDPTAPGNVVANGVAVGTPADNTIHTTNGCGVPGTFGPLSHTYPASVTTAVQVCVVTYHNKDTKKTAGGSTRQTDNSIEENDDHKPMVCMAFNPPPPPNDVCPNIEGVQTAVPSGMVKDSAGNCVTPPTDLCPNIEGVQTAVPAGMVRDASGNCVPPGPITQTVEKVVTIVEKCTCPAKVVKKPVKKAKKVKKVKKAKKKIKVKGVSKKFTPRVLPHTR